MIFSTNSCVSELLRLAFSTVTLRQFVAAAAGLRHSRAPALRLPRLRELVYFGGGELAVSKSIKAIHGSHLIKPDDLYLRSSNLMHIPNADYLKCTGSENLRARLWRLPPRSANTLHKHIRAEEFSAHGCPRRAATISAGNAISSGRSRIAVAREPHTKRILTYPFRPIHKATEN